MAIQHLNPGATVKIDGTIATCGESTVSGTVAVSSVAGGTVAVSGLGGTSAVALTEGGTVAVSGYSTDITGTVAVGGNVAVTSAALAYRAGDGSAVPIRVDGPTYALQTIDYAHHEIHTSSHFFYANHAALGSGGIQNYVIVTPDTTAWAHMMFHVDSSVKTGFQIIENTDLTGTTPATTYNSNRNSAGTATTLIYTDATGTAGGTRMFSYVSGASTNQSSEPMGNRGENEIILKQNTKYAVIVTSHAADALTNFICHWYEHTNTI